jgi:hypothetical protein
MTRIFYIFLFTFFTMSCERTQSIDIKETLREVSYDGVKIPEPKFDKDPLEIIKEFKSKYNSKQAVIARPAWYNSKEDYDYWLKVEFLNPEIPDKDFKKFGRQVALEVVEHLSNDEDFKKIEVSAVNKKGFIITFSNKQNIFFYLDSLNH